MKSGFGTSEKGSTHSLFTTQNINSFLNLGGSMYKSMTRKEEPLRYTQIDICITVKLVQVQVLIVFQN